ncbi:MAG: peptidoglycan DD-metalloendopeptidase family protein [Gaiellaceae bacterium]
MKRGSSCATVGAKTAGVGGITLVCAGPNGKLKQWVAFRAGGGKGSSGRGHGGSNGGGQGRGGKRNSGRGHGGSTGGGSTGGGSNGGGSNGGGSNGGGSNGGGSNGGGSNGGAQGGPTPAQQAPPVIENLPVVLGTYDSSTGRAGDFLFTHDQSPAKGPISEFADQIATGSGTKLTSEIGFDWLAQGTPILVVAAGIVTKENFQSDTQDYEIWEQPVAGSQWTIIYDHVDSPAVAEGATVAAGQRLGTAHPNGGSTAFSELQLVQRVSDVTHQWCPTKYLDSNVAATVATALRQLMSDWEAYRGDTSIYDPAKDVEPGCLQETYVAG